VDLDRVVEDLAPRVLRYALARTRSRTLAEDVAQEALAALVQRWRRLGPPDSPDAFVFAIAARRARRALVRRALMVPLRAAMHHADSGPDPDATTERSVELQRILAALSRLGRRDREALLLSAAGGLQVKEISRITGSSIAAVKMRMHRARKRLRLALEDEARHV
jgi:RNA polymerase sigma-70 factor (ECF subfamily)